jgi:glycosyltransferase involved in cell wall biosynthesis
MRAGGVPDSQLARVPSGVELPSRDAAQAEARSRVSLREELGLPANAKLIVTVAALAPHKDHATLLAAAAIVVRTRADAHFVWAGEGECRPALERRRRELSLESRVHLLGFRDDASALQVQCDLFVLSSYLEGLGTALLDAQALGLPIVATAVGGIPDVIENDANGRLVPPRDPAALAAAILEALDHPERAARWASHAGETVRAFSADAMVEASLREYRRILEPEDGPAR